MSFLQSFLPALLPLLFAVFIYALLYFLLIPLYRRHRARYSQYLPLNSSSSHSNNNPSVFSRTITFIRSRLPSSLFLFPTLGSWHRRYGRYRTSHATATDSPQRHHHPTETDHSDASSNSSTDTNSLFGDEEGEALTGFNLPESRRTEQGRLPTRTADVISAASDRRLSRELEQGFRDDSSSSSSSPSISDAEDDRHRRPRHNLGNLARVIRR